jgi:hypothetical protein
LRKDRCEAPCPQKVLLKMDRNNITPSYLRKLRAVVLRTMAIRFRRGRPAGEEGAP